MAIAGDIRERATALKVVAAAKERFGRVAEAAKTNCPVSKALSATPISLTSRLAWTKKCPTRRMTMPALNVGIENQSSIELHYEDVGADGTPHRVPVEGAFEADNAHVTMHAVLAGMGIAVIPFYHVREAVEAGLAEVVLDDFTLEPILAHAVWPSGTRTPSRVRRFVNLLVRRLKKEVVI